MPIGTAGSPVHIQGSGPHAHLSHSAPEPSREACPRVGVTKANQFSELHALIAHTPKRLFMLAAGLLVITVYARNDILNLAPYDLRILKMLKVLGG
jgi:hypothetical protein